jgi:hypothetical protein
MKICIGNNDAHNFVTETSCIETAYQLGKEVGG